MADITGLSPLRIDLAEDNINLGTKLDTIDGSLNLIEGYTDGLETALTAANASLDAIELSTGILDNAIAGNEMQVDVVAPLPAGDANIGNMDIVTLPAGNLGMQLMAASLSMVPASNITDATYIGDVKFGEALPAGSANIGDVDILTIAAGDNNIGNVDIVTLPAGNLGMQLMAASLSMVPASNITDATYIGDIKFGEALPAGTANIGDVDVLSIAAGDNNIGNVDIVTLPAGELVTDPLYVRVGDGTAVYSETNPFPVVVSSIGTVTDTYATSAAVAAGATWSMDSGTFANGQAAGVGEITFSSTVPLKAQLFRTLNAVETGPYRTFFTSGANPSFVYQYSLGDDSFCSGIGGVGANKFTLKLTNMDSNTAADMYASIGYSVE